MEKRVILIGLLIVVLLSACRASTKEEVQMQIPTWNQVETISVKEPAWRQKFETPEGCTLVVKSDKEDLEDYIDGKQRYLSTAKKNVWVIMKVEKEKEFFLEYEFEDKGYPDVPRIVVLNRAVECASKTYAAEFYCTLDASKENIRLIEDSLNSLACAEKAAKEK